MKKAFLIAGITLPFLFFFSCRHDATLPEYQVSFSTDILPIMSSNCWHSGCHSDTAMPAGAGSAPLETYEEITSNNYVVPGKPHSSRIYNAITGDGEELMPRDNYPALNDMQIRKIYIWIAQGAKNN